LDEAVNRNIDAAYELARITRTSLGPNGTLPFYFVLNSRATLKTIFCSLIGMNKMVINHLEKLFVTNDAATIMKELDVVHPAAKLLVMASEKQEAEVQFPFSIALLCSPSYFRLAITQTLSLSLAVNYSKRPNTC
jgi:T-complex protein 1 subunit theta